jgi:hypothetical protein
MASRIQGITVEIGGDTTKLSKALQGVNGEIKNTQTQLKDVQRLLKLDPSNTELLSQKQRLLKDAIGETKEKLETLKTAQEQAKKQLEEGTLGQDKYDALQREIIETEEELRRLQQEAATTSTALATISTFGSVPNRCKICCAFNLRVSDGVLTVVTRPTGTTASSTTDHDNLHLSYAIRDCECTTIFRKRSCIQNNHILIKPLLTSRSIVRI